MNRAIIAAALLLVATPALPHEWYPYECCSDQDCAPLAADKVQERDGGFVLWDGRRVSYRDVKPSPDGQFHLCEHKWAENTADRKILCFWAPVGGS